jgi:hypothetical protein
VQHGLLASCSPCSEGHLQCGIGARRAKGRPLIDRGEQDGIDDKTAFIVKRLDPVVLQ